MAAQEHDVQRRPGDNPAGVLDGRMEEEQEE